MGKPSSEEHCITGVHKKHRVKYCSTRTPMSQYSDHRGLHGSDFSKAQDGDTEKDSFSDRSNKIDEKIFVESLRSPPSQADLGLFSTLFLQQDPEVSAKRTTTRTLKNSQRTQQNNTSSNVVKRHKRIKSLKRVKQQKKKYANHQDRKEHNDQDLYSEGKQEDESRLISQRHSDTSSGFTSGMISWLQSLKSAECQEAESRSLWWLLFGKSLFNFNAGVVDHKRKQIEY